MLRQAHTGENAIIAGKCDQMPAFVIYGHIVPLIGGKLIGCNCAVRQIGLCAKALYGGEQHSMTTRVYLLVDNTTVGRRQQKKPPIIYMQSFLCGSAAIA